MKKLLLSAVFAMVALTTTFAANLNPFAYGLSSSLSADQSTLTVYYSLNAPATSVKVVVMNGNTVVAEKDCSSLGLTKGNYTTTISTTDFPTDAELTWKVEVKGAAVNGYAMHNVKYNAYHPSSVDIDNNPESAHFGRILCNESMQEVKGLTKDKAAATNGKNYLGTENGAGIFEFNAAFEYIGSYNGGKKFPINRYGVTGDASANQAYVPRRIRISDDSRIFVTSLNSEGDVLWELNPDKLNEWTTVIADGTRSTVTNEKRNIIDGSGNFIAGPNVGFDVHGSGKDLKLVMLSSADEGWKFYQSAFKCVQYNLGTEKTWNKQPSKTIFKNLAVYPLQAQVQYDKDGGVWFIQYNSNTNSTYQPGLAHWNVNNTNQTPDYIVARNNTCNAGFRYNNDYSKVIIANNSGNASVYDVTIGQNGVPQLSNAVAVDMTAMGSNLNDFAWDYADNIYVVSNSNEFVAVYPSPHSADKVVTTPAAAKYNVVLSSNTQLNPFAYGLRSSLDANNPMQLNVSFSVNASATSVEVVVYDVETNEVAYTQVCPTYSEKHDYQLAVDLSKIPAEYRDGVKNLNWRVDVKGAAVEKPTFVKNDVRLYIPTSVDIDNNPENANFGTVFCVESRDGGKGNDTYLSEKDGMGLYIFNADGTPRKIPNEATERYGYNGAITDLLTTTEFNSSPVGTEIKGNSYFLYRVRVSDDGRVFITSLSPDGHVLFEANKEVFSHPDAPDWSSKTTWTKVISKANSNTTQKTFKNNCSDINHKYCNIYNLYTDENEFIAGPNCGFDVRGSGSNLKLLMLSGCKAAISGIVPFHFYCCEYDLGELTMWNVEPSRKIFTGNNGNLKIVNYGGVQVQYDKQGNVWLCQHRGINDNTPTLLKISPSGIVTNVDGKTIPYRRCGAIRFNEDFSRVVVASNVHDDAGGGFTYYDVDDNGNWTKKSTVDTYTHTGYSLMDFAWDYAGNLYMAADAATNGECIAVYAMPHAADRVVSTPAASRYAFTVSCQAGKQCTVTTICNPSEAGTITCSVAGNTRAAGVFTLGSCTELTVTAVPEDGYKFINWTDGNGNVLSTNKEFTFYVTEDITLKANFEYATYTGIVWKSLFMNDQDIADESATHPGTNERLWRLYQVEFEKFCDENGETDNPSAHADNVINGKKEFNTGAYFSYRGDINVVFLTDDQKNSPFRWLGKYITLVNGKEVTATTKGDPGVVESVELYTRWVYFPYLFFNRTDIPYNSGAASKTNVYVNGTGSWTRQDYWKWDASKNDYDRSKSFTDYGRPEYWRPYWAEAICNLPMTMKYSDDMPTIATWKHTDCAIGSMDGVTPSNWYKWNIPANNPAVKDVDYQKYFILAWRKGSPTAEEIVHHVYESNMELHASYVLKNIDEEDRVDVSKYDASNDDVIQLMLNRHWVNLDPDTTKQPTHTLTVTRKLRAGMYNTICLPFGVDLSGLQDNNEYHHPLKDAEAWELDTQNPTSSLYDASGDPVIVLNFNKVTDLEAGKPYLIKLQGNEDVTDDMVFSGVSSKPYVYPQSGGGIIFQPTINPTQVPEGSLILVENGRLAETTTDGSMLGMRAYFQIDESNPFAASEIRQRAAEGRVYLSMNKPVTTSIPVAPEAEQPKQPKVRKVMRDGQIYILRGDEVYTITGNRVK